MRFPSIRAVVIGALVIISCGIWFSPSAAEVTLADRIIGILFWAFLWCCWAIPLFRELRKAERDRAQAGERHRLEPIHVDGDGSVHTVH